MPGPETTEDPYENTILHTNEGMNGDRSQEVEYLPPEYYNSFLSKVTSDLKMNPIRVLNPLESIPGMLSLLTGKPSEDVLPFTSIHFSATSPNDPSKEIEVTFTSSILKEALQYSQTDGMPRVKEWIMGLQEHLHKRKHGEGWSVAVGVGSQDLICKAIIALVNHSDSILVESPAYPGLVPLFTSLHCEQIQIETDSMGLNPALLRTTLENWPMGKPKPKLLYTVPYGGNPSGTTTTTQRRREILALAKEHDFLIFEDDPYYWLYFRDDERPPSYFQLELALPEVGRVIRFDSFSKIISAGLRFGWASGPKVLIDAINVQTGTSNLQPSSLTQMMVLALVEQWGYVGFDTFTRSISNIYRIKRDIFDKALQEHLGDLAEWNRPESGLFFWVKLLLNPEGDGDIDMDKLVTKGSQHGILVLPGTSCLPNGQKSAHVRLSFSALTEEMTHEALKRLRALVISEREEHALAMSGKPQVAQVTNGHTKETEGSA